jgi:hypothetical protein
MKLFDTYARLFVGLMIAASFTACGGGGGGGATSSAAATGVTVVPALGAFSNGVRVEAYDPVTGLAIGDGATTDATGTAVIDLGTHATSFILKVTGNATAKYFEEGLTTSGTDVNFTGNDVLLALVPASAAVTKGASIGVTPLTHMAAGFAVNSLSDLKVNIPAGKDAADVMYEAVARVRYITGLPVQASERGKITFNPLLAPSVLSATTKAAGINLSQAGGYYGLYLSELSKAVSTENTPRSSLDLAKSLFNRAAAMKLLVSANTLATTSQAVTDFLASADLLALNSAAAAVGSGSSIFLSTCKTLPNADALTFNAVFTGANQLNTAAGAFVPSANDLAQMVLDLTFATDSKITKNLVSPFTETSTGANGC